MMMRTSARRALGGMAIFVGLTLSLAACRRAAQPAPAAGDPVGDLARLQRANEFLERQVDLAAGKDFYLILDPAASRLTLMLKGATLQHFSVRSLQVGHPRVAWAASRDTRHVQSEVWSGGELVPPRQIDRLVVQAAPPGKEGEEPPAPPIPPTPEEMYPVPARYYVRFAEGLSLEVRPREGDATVGWWPRVRAATAERWRDAMAALRWRDRDAIRVRLVLDPKDAQSLYRSLPPSVRLLVLSSDGPS